MGRLAILSEAIMQVARPPAIPEDQPYRQALALLRDGRMPNGGTWRDGPPPLFVRLGGADTCVVVRMGQEAVDDTLGRGTRYTGRFAVRPARGTSAGVSIDPSATEAFMSQALDAPCNDHLALERLGAAVRVVAEEREEAIRGAIRSLFWEDGLWRFVGWPQRDRWVLSDLSVGRIDLGEALVDENRGESWVAKRWEAWVPLTVDIEAMLRRRT